MLDAVLGGESLQGVADLAAVEAGGPVAIVLSARGLTACSPEGIDPDRLTAEVEIPVFAGEAEIGAVKVFASENGAGPDGKLPVDREEVARTAALAAVAEVAVTEARDEVEHDLRASLIEDLREGSVEGAEVARRAARLGCDTSRGALALVAEIRSHKPRGAAALIETEWTGSVAEAIDDRLYAILPARGGDDAPERATEQGRKLVARLRSHGPTAVSSFYPDPAELHQAVREAELVLGVVRRDDRLAEQIEAGAGDGVYRLLFRALISDPDEVRSFYEDTVAPVVEYDREYRSELLGTLEAYLANDCNMNATARAIFAHRHTVAYRLLFRALISDPDEVRSFYEDTVAPVVEYDREYRSELLGTLEAYLANDCNMNATARAIFAHRHTVAYRLDRVRELSGLDPGASADRERLGLGIKAFRILAPTLPR
ncbi:MAG: helix-turn-helix domain-containing protein [Actinomycetota bacterium]